MIAEALHNLAETIEAATGIRTVTDPGEFLAPGIIIEPPTITGATMGAYTLELPVSAVYMAPSDGRAIDWLLGVVPQLLDVLGERTANPATYSPNTTQSFPAYRITATLTVRTAL